MAYKSSIASLSKDLCSEILSDADPKSILICKSVSKSWNDIVSNEYFAKLYSQKRPSIIGFFYQSSFGYPEKLQYLSVSPRQEDVTDPPSCLGFLDSPAILLNLCNGLLLWLVGKNKLVISNPLTKKFIPLDGTFDFTKRIACGIAFDPSISDHFKVILLVVGSDCVKSRVFSSEGMNWDDGIETQELFKAPPYGRFKGLFLNGIIYWELLNHSLYAYNVSDNVSCLIRLPVMKKSTENSLAVKQHGCLGESEGSLHYCQVLESMLSVWESKQMPLVSSATWALKYRIDLCGVMKMYPEMNFSSSQALAFVDECHGILMSIKHGIIDFSFGDNAIRKRYDTPIAMSRSIRNVNDANVNVAGYVQPCMFFPFKQSLALFNIRKKTHSIHADV